ncbi:MAG: S41 family peptidase, partial [Chloroflexi bacterium]|nr:S41 family peptidase [Chloroflexota bacterium]
DGEPAVTGDGDINTHLLRGTAGTAVTVTVRTPGSQPRDVAITRANLSTVEPVEQRLLPGKKRIGYILIPTFFEESIEERVRVALRTLMKGGRLDGLIVDLRINGGGAYPVLLANLGFYTRGTVGYLVDRKGRRESLTVRAERIGNSQSVPIVVLIGPSTQSYAEVFAGTLRVRKRATLLGQKSGGNIETLHAHRFEDGSVAWIAEETFRLPNGTHWEGQGLTPDILVDQGWDEFTGENDPVIAAAVKVLSK